MSPGRDGFSPPLGSEIREIRQNMPEIHVTYLYLYVNKPLPALVNRPAVTNLMELPTYLRQCWAKRREDDVKRIRIQWYGPLCPYAGTRIVPPLLAISRYLAYLLRTPVYGRPRAMGDKVSGSRMAWGHTWHCSRSLRPR